VVECVDGAAAVRATLIPLRGSASALSSFEKREKRAISSLECDKWQSPDCATLVSGCRQIIVKLPRGERTLDAALSFAAFPRVA
jgi:hypothetical protein